MMIRLNNFQPSAGCSTSSPGSVRRKISLPAQNKFLALRNENLLQRVKKWRPWEELWQDCQFLAYFFTFFSISEKVALAQVKFEITLPAED